MPGQRLQIGGGAFYTGRQFGGYADNSSATQDASGVVTIHSATKVLERTIPGYWRFDARLIGLFQESRALILPSISETFGLVLLEAWAAGTTVISSRTSGASSLVKHGENGWLFDLSKPPELQTAVDVILNNPGLRDQFAAAGKEFAATQFSVSAIAAQVKKLYEELIEKKFGGASLPPSR